MDIPHIPIPDGEDAWLWKITTTIGWGGKAFYALGPKDIIAGVAWLNAHLHFPPGDSGFKHYIMAIEIIPYWDNYIRMEEQTATGGK